MVDKKKTQAQDRTSLRAEIIFQEGKIQELRAANTLLTAQFKGADSEVKVCERLIAIQDRQLAELKTQMTNMQSWLTKVLDLVSKEET